jgi:hypothetical protein
MKAVDKHDKGIAAAALPSSLSAIGAAAGLHRPSLRWQIVTGAETAGVTQSQEAVCISDRALRNEEKSHLHDNGFD